MQTLDLAYRPRALTQPGCIEAILEYLGIEVAPEWLWGASGIAFFMNVLDDLCPSAHHSHGFNMNQRGQNVGYNWRQFLSFTNRDDYEPKRAEAWQEARRSIDAGHPGLLWHWEWMVVRGYDGDGYVVDGKIQDRLPWEDLGGAVGWMELVLISPGAPADDLTTIREALDVAVSSWDAPERWGATGVPEGYQHWLDALEGQVNPWGAADMAAVYAACRRFAAGFLIEASERITGPAAVAIADAVTHYSTAADELGKAAEALPLRFHVCSEPGIDDEDGREAADAEMAANLADDDRRAAAITAVTNARDAESSGINHLRGALAAL